MAAQPLTDAQKRDVLAALRAHPTRAAAARAMGLPAATFASRLRRARLDPPAGDDVPPPPSTAPAFRVEPLPDEQPSATILLEQRTAAFKRKQAAKEARRLIRVDVPLEGPFGIAHFGDPHVDDDGTDLSQLQADVSTVNATEGLFAGNVGDFTNNWVGRLARLYGDQSTSSRDAWTLCSWLVESMRWLYLVGGNHDAWSGAGDPIRWIAQQVGALYQMHGARLALHTPNGRVFRINARHDFKGHSMWNTAHGAAKAATMGWRDHVLTCGHTHVSGYQVLKDPASGLISHAIRVASYKVYDSYAESQGLPNQTIFTCPVTIIDPAHPDDSNRCVSFFSNPQEAAEFLTWKRQRWAAGRSS